MNDQKNFQLNNDDAEKQLNNNINMEEQVEKKKKKQIVYFFIILFVLLSIISVITFIFYINKNNNLSNTTSKEIDFEKNQTLNKIDEKAEIQKTPLKTYQNDLWGIEFKYPDQNSRVHIDDHDTPISIYIYTNEKLNYKDILYIMPRVATDKNIIDFESLKNYLEKYDKEALQITEEDTFQNENQLNFYKTIRTIRPEDYSEYYDYNIHNYVYYNGVEPNNFLDLDYRRYWKTEPENEAIFKQIINTLKFIKIDEEKKDAYLSKKQINPDCAGWYATNEYRAKNDIINLTDIENITEKTGYTYFNDKNINFYFPEKWEVKIDEYDNNEKIYRIYYLEHTYFSISTDNIENFINDYNTCISRCFTDADPTSPFSWKAFHCSEDYSKDNLNKLLSGNYINFISTGSLPPGGAGSFSFERIFDDNYITASYSSEDFYFYPKAQELYSQEKRWSTFSEEEKRIISDEQNYYKQEFYKIIKSVKLLK